MQSIPTGLTTNPGGPAGLSIAGFGLLGGGSLFSGRTETQAGQFDLLLNLALGLGEFASNLGDGETSQQPAESGPQSTPPLIASQFSFEAFAVAAAPSTDVPVEIELSTIDVVDTGEFVPAIPVPIVQPETVQPTLASNVMALPEETQNTEITLIPTQETLESSQPILPTADPVSDEDAPDQQPTALLASDSLMLASMFSASVVHSATESAQPAASEGQSFKVSFALAAQTRSLRLGIHPNDQAPAKTETIAWNLKDLSQRLYAAIGELRPPADPVFTHALPTQPRPESTLPTVAQTVALPSLAQGKHAPLSPAAALGIPALNEQAAAQSIDIQPANDEAIERPRATGFEWNPVPVEKSGEAPRMPNLIEQVRQAAAFLADKAEGVIRMGDKGVEANLRLYPPDLGGLRVLLTVKHDLTVNAQFIAERADTRQLIETHLNQFRQTMAQHGMIVDRIQVSVQSPAASNGSNNENGLTQQQQRGESRRDGPDAQGRRDRAREDSAQRNPKREGEE